MELDKETNKMVDKMLKQSMVMLVEQLGGRVELTGADIDATGDRVLTVDMVAETKSFIFTVVDKSDLPPED